MKVLKIAALVALASLPLLLLKKRKGVAVQPVEYVDSEEIFDQELSAE
jgi:hypothetical protein